MSRARAPWLTDGLDAVGSVLGLARHPRPSLEPVREVGSMPLLWIRCHFGEIMTLGSCSLGYVSPLLS